MGDQCAQKKPPERLCPRGAKDTTLFRERLDVARPRSSGVAGRHGERCQCVRSAPPASVPAVMRSVARRNDESSPHPDADPSTWIVSLIFSGLLSFHHSPMRRLAFAHATFGIRMCDAWRPPVRRLDRFVKGREYGISRPESRPVFATILKIIFTTE